MRKLIRIGVAAAVMIGATLPALAQQDRGALLVLLDVSGSMKESVPGGVKRELARRGLLETLASLPTTTSTSLRLLGEGSGAEECGASRVAVPFAPFDNGSWSTALDEVRWDGATPLVHSMREAFADLRDLDVARKEMLIIGDGEETCGEDPVAVARAEADGIRVHTISLGRGVSPQLAGIALVTDGTYSTAFDETSFDASVKDALPAPDTQPTSDAAAGEALLEVVLDVSNSMWGQVDGRVKMDLAREALAGALGGLPAEVSVGLRAYGHRVAFEDKVRGCEDTELVVPPTPGSREAVVRRASSLRPTGQTPIALSLRAAAADVAEHEGNAVLLLISDGIESCGGDPVAVAAELRSEGSPLVIHTVGLGVDQETSAQLEALAAAGGGTYFDAPTADDLMRGVDVAVRRSTEFILAEHDSGSRFPRAITRVSGGIGVAEGELLVPGTYSLQEHLWKEVRFFEVEGQAGDRLVLSGMVSALAIGRLRDGTVTYMGDTTMFMADRLDADGERLRGRGLMVRGEMGEWAEVELTVGPDGRARFSLGRPQGNVHRDIVFRIARQTRRPN
ncbi:MAG: VWA domain-containing protein [Acidobacteria bacterium]|nr:VWA domain-containing protein [Acidobacteriota bacterium]